jgi:hypothetical protein
MISVNIIISMENANIYMHIIFNCNYYQIEKNLARLIENMIRCGKILAMMMQNSLIM